MAALRLYQELAADFLYANDRTMMLAPVGAGKTCTALTAMQAMVKDGVVKRFLVVAPKRVCESVWPVEAKKWAQMDVAVAVGTPTARIKALNSKAPVVVTNYDNLQWLAGQDLNFDGIVFDELTKMKNPSGKRFKALHKIIDQFKVRIGLTGSFTSNGLEDVFGQCKIIDQSLLGRSKGAFMQTYFIPINPEYGEWMPRPKALENVMAKIKPATFVLEAGEYKDKLPELHTVELRCDMDRTLYEKMKRDFVVQFPSAEVIAQNAAVVTGKLQQMAGGWVYETTKTPTEVPGKFKITQTPVWFSAHKFDLLDDLLEENQRANTIIFYMYKEELAELKRRYPQAITLDDENAIERWNKGEIELLLAHPKSAQFGLNLQFGGNRMVFTSLPWSLTDFEQAIGRIHRSGQRHDVWVYILLTNKTVDEKIWASLNDKQTLAQIAMNELAP
ncbi:HELICc domain containing protein [uncultured Caudovirales phage]|uniref:HELICc domain containing protein n=1 Tax=uncultured Caudovirales phage TaxID=2100421 RepID=A0A6J5NZU8_9CAUD|nr:HELICc domain containing protein [uncultured Caudovirales phage]